MNHQVFLILCSCLLASARYINVGNSFFYPSKSDIIRYRDNEINPGFCNDKAEGHYCDPTYPDEIIICPSNKRKPCPASRSCKSVGKVPDCYYCEVPFDVDEICRLRIGGLFCPEPSSGSFKYIVECKGQRFVQLIECPGGSMCYTPPENQLQAMCLVGYQDYCPRFQRPPPKLTSRRQFQTMTKTIYESIIVTRYDTKTPKLPTPTAFFPMHNAGRNGLQK